MDLIKGARELTNYNDDRKMDGRGNQEDENKAYDRRIFLTIAYRLRTWCTEWVVTDEGKSHQVTLKQDYTSKLFEESGAAAVALAENMKERWVDVRDGNKTETEYNFEDCDALSLDPTCLRQEINVRQNPNRLTISLPRLTRIPLCAL